MAYKQVWWVLSRRHFYLQLSTSVSLSRHRFTLGAQLGHGTYEEMRDHRSRAHTFTSLQVPLPSCFHFLVIHRNQGVSVKSFDL